MAQCLVSVDIKDSVCAYVTYVSELLTNMLLLPSLLGIQTCELQNMMTQPWTVATRPLFD